MHLKWTPSKYDFLILPDKHYQFVIRDSNIEILNRPESVRAVTTTMKIIIQIYITIIVTLFNVNFFVFKNFNIYTKILLFFVVFYGSYLLYKVAIKRLLKLIPDKPQFYYEIKDKNLKVFNEGKSKVIPLKTFFKIKYYSPIKQNTLYRFLNSTITCNFNEQLNNCIYLRYYDTNNIEKECKLHGIPNKYYEKVLKYIQENIDTTKEKYIPPASIHARIIKYVSYFIFLTLIIFPFWVISSFGLLYHLFSNYSFGPNLTIISMAIMFLIPLLSGYYSKNFDSQKQLNKLLSILFFSLSLFILIGQIMLITYVFMNLGNMDFIEIIKLGIQLDL